MLLVDVSNASVALGVVDAVRVSDGFSAVADTLANDERATSIEKNAIADGLPAGNVVVMTADCVSVGRALGVRAHNATREFQ